MNNLKWLMEHENLVKFAAKTNILSEASHFPELYKTASFASKMASTPLLKFAQTSNSALLNTFKEAEINRIHQWSNIANAWQSRLGFVMGSETYRQAVLTHLNRMSQLTILAETSVFKIYPDNIGNLIKLEERFKAPLYKNLTRFSKSYSVLCQSFEDSESTILAYPPAVSELSPVEYFNTADLIENISTDEELTEEKEIIRTEIIQETQDSLEHLLAEIDKDLIKMWRGATEAVYSDNPDRVRHFCISSREMLTHILHKLAPDDKVKNWTSSPKHFSNNRPTRQARLSFICRNIELPPFLDFLDEDIVMLLRIIDFLNKGTHTMDLELSEKQLKTIMFKIESALRLLIQVSKEVS